MRWRGAVALLRGPSSRPWETASPGGLRRVEVDQRPRRVQQLPEAVLRARPDEHKALVAPGVERLVRGDHEDEVIAERVAHGKEAKPMLRAPILDPVGLAERGAQRV